MWNITKDGFVSIVAYDPGKDRAPKSPFKSLPGVKTGTHLLVRARRSEHLEPLKREVPNLVIVDDPHADYRYRCVVTRKQYKRFLCAQVDNIDYWSHFKEACRNAQPAHLKEPMYSAVMQIWGIMGRLTSVGASWEQKKYKSTGPPSTGSAVSHYPAAKGYKQYEFSDTSPLADLDLSPWSKTGTALDLVSVRQSIRESGGSLIFTSDELTRMTDEAFEVVTRLQEKYGVTTKVADPLVNRFIREMSVGS